MKTQLNLPVSAHVDCIIDAKNIVIARVDTNEHNLLPDIVKLINNTAKVHYLVSTAQDEPCFSIMVKKDQKDEILKLCIDSYKKVYGISLFISNMDYNTIDQSYSILLEDKGAFRIKLYVTPITVYSQES